MPHYSYKTEECYKVLISILNDLILVLLNTIFKSLHILYNLFSTKFSIVVKLMNKKLKMLQLQSQIYEN